MRSFFGPGHARRPLPGLGFAGARVSESTICRLSDSQTDVHVFHVLSLRVEQSTGAVVKKSSHVV